MTRRGDFSLRHFSLSSLSWYFAVLAGWALLAVGIVKVGTASEIDLAGPLIMAAVLLIVLELLPLVQGRGHDPQGVVMSTPFTFAILAVWGVWPAILLVAVAAVASDLRAHKQWWKVLFNPAQYALSVGAGYLVMLAFGDAPGLAHAQRFRVDDLIWLALVWIAYYVVNLVLVAGVLAFSESFTRTVSDDFTHVTVITFSVFSLSPLIVVVAQTTWTLLPLLLVPLLLLYWTAQMSLRREHEAGHDALTGLPNRASLQYELDEAFRRYQQDHRPFGLILIDLDDFKRVNDTLGHAVGDELLRVFAQRLEHAVRPSDHVARLGGDEFAVLVRDASEDDVCGVARRIDESIADSIELSGVSLDAELSLGVAVCPTHGTDGNVLLQRADVAMYVAKTNRSVVEVYSPDRDDNSADRLGMLGELRQALDDDDLELHYQPKVSVTDSSLLGMEALIRWQHPVRGNVRPDEFIPVAERSGIMPQLTERVIRLALEQMARWRAAGVDVPVAVNVAPTDLVGERLVMAVAEGLREFRVPARMLRLEITERIITHEIEDANRTLRTLRDMGVTISLDDFGTGYSSLLRLTALPVDEIKIDRVFVSRLSEGPRAVGIVRTLIGLAHSLEVPAIAEGVENEAQLRLLVEMGCDGVQGFHIARPMTADAAAEWFHTRTVAPAPAQPAPEVSRRPPRRPPATRIHRPIAPAEGASPTRT